MDISTIYAILLKDIQNFYHSGAFTVIKFILAIYVLVLLVDLVLLLVQRGVAGNLRQIMYGMNMPKELVSKKNKLRLQWDKIKKRLESPNESEYKVAIIEADNVIDDIIRRMGYKGDNLSERIQNVPAGQLEHLDEIRAAHEIRNRVIHEEDFAVSREQARDVIGNYEHFLRHFEVLD